MSVLENRPAAPPPATTMPDPAEPVEHAAANMANSVVGEKDNAMVEKKPQAGLKNYFASALNSLTNGKELTHRTRDCFHTGQNLMHYSWRSAVLLPLEQGS